MGRSGAYGHHWARWALRAGGCAAAGLLALTGCTSSAGTRSAGAAGSPPAATATPSASAAAPGAGAGGTGSTGSPGGSSAAPLVPRLDESKQPVDAAGARALLGRIVIDREAFGPGVVRSSPFESAPGRWPVLDDGCVWQTSALPPDVLATSTRHFQVPAGDGHGRVRINATVTVHRTREESGWETAHAMEEVLRCPGQVLSAGEELKNLWGASLYLGEQLNGWAEDAFTESGQYVSEEDGGPYRYVWSQGQFGPVTVAVAGKGAAGFSDDALNALVVQGTSRLMIQLKQALAKEGG